MRVTKRFREAVEASTTFSQNKLALASGFHGPEFSRLLCASRVAPTAHTRGRLAMAARLIGFEQDVFEPSDPCGRFGRVEAWDGAKGWLCDEETGELVTLTAASIANDLAVGDRVEFDLVSGCSSPVVACNVRRAGA